MTEDEPGPLDIAWLREVLDDPETAWVSDPQSEPYADDVLGGALDYANRELDEARRLLCSRANQIGVLECQLMLMGCERDKAKADAAQYRQLTWMAIASMVGMLIVAATVGGK